MKIGIFPPYGEDHDRNIAFCHDVGAKYTALRVPGIPSGEALAKLKRKYEEAGVNCPIFLAPRVTTEALLDEHLRRSEVETLRGIIAAMGEAGLEILHLYVSSVHAPSSAEEREVFMQRLIAYYRQIVAEAERSRVKIATHTYNSPSKLVWNYETMNRILMAVPSEYNGVLFCTGKTQLAGDDMYETIRKFGPRMVMVHVRNVGGDYQPPALDEKRLEVRFDAGDVNLVEVFKVLKEVGFAGPVFPEHYPPIGGDPIAGLAWTIGYLKAMEASLQV